MTLLLSQIDPSALPKASDAARAEAVYSEWLTKVTDHAADHKELCAAAKALVFAIAGNSPYLARSILNEPLFFARMLSHPLHDLRQEIQDGIVALVQTPPSMADLMRGLRVEKRRLALLTATADVAGLWSLEEVTETLSDFAAAAAQAAVCRLLASAYESGDLARPEGARDLASAVARSGYTILAMGKLGARELNYSSDIDLIVLYDAQTVTYTGRRSMQDLFVRMTRELVRALNDRTADGYVFRVDLRLRPDAGATPPALSMDAAELYYQSTGLNWERAAMIKARPIAGDLAAGHDFLERIKAFVWRKNLDYAAVQDIKDIKLKIHSHHRHGTIDLRGQDIKLGYGGIREIEFFVQIYQLIMGGREHALRVPQTLLALRALRRDDRISQADERTLAHAYRYLRRLEHRIQMIDDEQTHQLPEADHDIARVATFMGYPSLDAFRAELIPLLEGVHAIYDDLAEEATGGDQPAAVADNLWDAFRDAAKAQAILDGWLEGRLRASRTERARGILKGLMPAILDALSKAPDPDGAIVRLDEFLARLPAGVQLFSLFQAHPWLLDMVIEIMGSAPALAAELGRNVALLDAVLSADFFEHLRPADELAAELDAVLARAELYEDVLDFTRRWANERKFQIGVQMLRQIIDAREAGAQLTRIAEVTMRALYPRMLAEFETQHGQIEGDMVVLGLGKLGARELTFQSDLDLIFLYDSAAETSNGPRPLPVSQYFARLGQRYINAISALTSEGRLFEVDMRLRPSGHAGPIAVALDTFVGYQKDKAWTWEHMALTRARAIIGSPALKDRATAAIADILRTPRDPDKLLLHVADMRRRMDKEFGTADPWSVKFVRGGLLDIEFITQYLILKTTPERQQVLSPHLGEALASLTEAGAIDSADGATLREALALLQNVQSYLRLCSISFDEGSAGQTLLSGLAGYCGSPDFAHLKHRLEATEAEVFTLFRRLIEDPAEALDDQAS
jgi:glutamate-ammonia-ligase adenylyltransferase